MYLAELSGGFAPPQGVLLRYLEPWKFHRLLEDRALWFASVLTLQAEDPSEATFTPAITLAWDRWWREERAPYLAQRSRDKGVSSFRADEYEASLARVDAAAVTASARETFVSSWRVADDETCRMWRDYGRDPAAVAIVSSVADLRAALEANPWHADVVGWLGRVRYVRDEVRPSGIGELGPVTVAYLKDGSYSDEDEVRVAVHSRDAPSSEGANYSIPLEVLIRAVVLSPWAGPDELAEVRGALLKAGLDVPIRRSALVPNVD